MLTKVRKWGNSQGLRVTKALLDEARIHLGDEVDVSVRLATPGKVVEYTFSYSRMYSWR